MRHKLKITDTDVVNLFNIDFYEVDGRKIIFYSKGAKYDSIFDSEKEALLVFEKINKCTSVEDLTKDRARVREW
tara:strand:- start:562 stop:783 length:222 start_codon:yes stop_codon:yes gene_type:complete